MTPHQMLDALSRAKNKIFVFVLSVLTLTTIFGSIMYLVEGPQIFALYAERRRNGRI